MKDKKKTFNFEKLKTTNNRGISTFLNPYSYLLARKNIELYEQFDNIYIDGILLVYLLGFCGIKVERKSFDMTSLAPVVFSEAEKNQYRIVLIGSNEGVANKAAEKILHLFPKLSFVKCYSGFFKGTEHREQIIEEIMTINPDLLIVGMGTPYQDQFLLEVKKKGWMGIGYTCGGFFHQTANTTQGQYYPPFFDKYNLRWLYRIIDEPKLFSRYFVKYPQAVILFLSDIWRFRRR